MIKSTSNYSIKGYKIWKRRLHEGRWKWKWKNL